MADIMPCMHCGGNGKVTGKRAGCNVRIGTYYQVLCNRCKARGPIVLSKGGDDDLCKIKAITLWNERDK